MTGQIQIAYRIKDANHMTVSHTGYLDYLSGINITTCSLKVEKRWQNRDLERIAAWEELDLTLAPLKIEKKTKEYWTASGS